MRRSEIEYWTRTFPEEQRQRREADRPRRLGVLTPEAAAFWINVLDRAEPIASAIPKKRPCDYGPWTSAIERIESVDKTWPAMGHVENPFPTSNLLGFARDASLPGWPDEHAHLVDFSLRFLEADVMLFGSGYTKRHLLRRLRQAALDPTQIARVDALVRRAVKEGTGLEEYREFCRLSRSILTDDFRDWLSETADGAFLTLNDLDGGDILYWIEKLGEKKFETVGRYGLSLSLKYAFSTVGPDHEVIKIKELPADNCIRRNAWRMLRHIRRTGV